MWVVKKSRVHGSGVFAKKEIQKLTARRRDFYLTLHLQKKVLKEVYFDLNLEILNIKSFVKQLKRVTVFDPKG